MAKIGGDNECNGGVIRMLEMVYDGHRVVLWDGAHLDSGEAEEESELETVGIDFADPDELALICAGVETVSCAVTLVANILMSASRPTTKKCERTSGRQWHV